VRSLLLSAAETAAAVRSGKVRAQEVIRASLDAIAATRGELNCFTDVLAAQAVADAAAIDLMIQSGGDPGPLAGVPFAVKNLYDVAGFRTLAGAKITREHRPATQDADAVRALRTNGAVLVGMLNMDEFAYGWTTENTHYGPTKNPHDHARTPGGSSGGAGAAVGAGVVPIALGSDTNGSIRVPAAFCGVYGLKPTYGLLSRAGTRLLSTSLDHVGPLAGSAEDLAIAFRSLQGMVPRKTADEHPIPSIHQLRVGLVSNEFGEAMPDAWSAVEAVAASLPVSRKVQIPEVDRARAAASLITASEAATAHRDTLQRRAKELDPLIRDRLLAAALLPATTYVHALGFKAWFRSQLVTVFRDLDVLITPCTPFFAPVIGRTGVDTSTKLSIGRFTQPFSLAGFPALSVPVKSDTALPVGVQLVAAPFGEALLLDLAAYLERAGIVGRWPLQRTAVKT
jgi:aspartyl-tRNA(Asn)/glutamyl-tRNA(Gln) amidotransferase subunit A